MKITTELREKIEKANEGKIPVENSFFKESLFLAALLEQSASEEINLITPLFKSDTPFYPGEFKTNDFVGQASTYLQYENLEESMFEDEEGEEGFKYYPRHCFFRLVSADKDIKNILINHVKYSFPFESDIFNLVYDLLIDECLNFYINYGQSIGFQMKINEKIEKIFEGMLCHFSCSEIFYMITKTMKDTLIYQRQQHISMTHARNMIAGNLERYSRSVKKNKWNVSSYGRHDYEKTSWVAYTLFDLCLEIQPCFLNHNIIDLYQIYLEKSENLLLQQIKRFNTTFKEAAEERGLRTEVTKESDLIEEPSLD